MVARALPDNYPLRPAGTLDPSTPPTAPDAPGDRTKLLGRINGYFDTAYEAFQHPDGS